jgi:hypothetical protein
MKISSYDSYWKISPMEDIIQYDVVELPSQGMFDSQKRKNLKVAYLNATDENVLASPNLIQTNQIVDELLSRKIIDKTYDISQMPEEDKQAVLIFLRNTAFGSKYKVHIEDGDEKFEVFLDLEEVATKPFTLVADVNGEFTMQLPKTKANLKFIFLSPNKKQNLEDLKRNTMVMRR